MNSKQILKSIKSMGNVKDEESMAKFGINTEKAYGVSVYKIRALLKFAMRDQKVADELWETEIHEARMAACFMGNPKTITETKLEKWVTDFDSWDVVDICCANLIVQTPFAHRKAKEWAKREEEFVRRAGFALMAALSVHDKEAKDKQFESFFPLIKKYSTDDRNFVKKSVNWALRRIGKRNLALNKKAIAVAKEINKIDSTSAHWIAKDALKELKSEKVQTRIKEKEIKNQ